jgi:membrane associated rhomboid family serine protease
MRWRWTATTGLIVALVVAFFLQHGFFYSIEHKYLDLSLDGLRQGFVWQLLSFQFLHAGLSHLVMNCVVLYIFGREVESILGKSRFLVLYFLSGVVGGLLQMLFALVLPQYFGGSVVGASAGIFGIVATFTTLFPNQLLKLFLLPIQFRAKTLLFVSLGFALLGILFPEKIGVGVAHAAHLGGIFFGFAWVKLGWHRDFVQLPWEGWFSGRRLRRDRSRKSKLIRATSIKIPGVSRAKSDDSADLPSEEFISREVDPILDKISQHGIQSLTERERKILEAARSKMAKR